jgi:phosphomannomutase
VWRVAPGELHLLHGLATHGGDLAGEGNGGVVHPAVGIARDGLAAAAAVLELIALGGRPLSELAAELPRLSRRRSTVPCAGEPQAEAALDAVATRLDVASGDPYDGVLVEAPGSWALVRRSATEPVLRISVEAGDAASAESLHRELRAALAGP